MILIFEFTKPRCPYGCMRCLDLQMWILKYKLLQLITLNILAKILGANRLNQRYSLCL